MAVPTPGGTAVGLPVRRGVAELCVVWLGFTRRLTTPVGDPSAEVTAALAGRSELLGCEQAPGLGCISQQSLPDTSGKQNPERAAQRGISTLLEIHSCSGLLGLCKQGSRKAVQDSIVVVIWDPSKYFSP